MTDETRKALEGSIAKWQAIVDGTGENQGPQNCPLCWMFRDDECRGCPVRERSGRHYCYGTPYTSFEDLDIAALECQDDDVRKALLVQRGVAAQAELDFLKSLL